MPDVDYTGVYKDSSGSVAACLDGYSGIFCAGPVRWMRINSSWWEGWSIADVGRRTEEPLTVVLPREYMT